MNKSTKSVVFEIVCGMKNTVIFSTIELSKRKRLKNWSAQTLYYNTKQNQRGKQSKKFI